MKINNSSSEKKIINPSLEKLKEFPNEEKVKFLFYDDTSLEYNKNFIISMSPSILNNVPRCNEYYLIKAPYGITKKDFSQFLHIYSNPTNKNEKFIGNDCKNLFPILKLMDFFNNEKLNVQIITNIILNELNCNIAIDLIIFSYDKLCFFSENGKGIDNAYFELFYQALEELSKNEMMIIKNIDKLKSLDAKIIEELIQKTFRNLLFGKYLIENNDDLPNKNEQVFNDINPMNYFEENEICSGDFNQMKNNEESKNNNNIKILDIKNLKNLIQFFMKINNLDNIFSLLTREYMSLLSSESINELQNLPNPSFEVKIPISLYESYYQEFPLDININNQMLILVIFYKLGDKSINVCIKLSSKKKEKIKHLNNKDKTNNRYSFEILTFLTNVVVGKGSENRIISIQNNLTSLSNSKSMYSILKVPDFNGQITNSNSTSNTNPNNHVSNNDFNNESPNDFIFIKVQIKLCYLYSVISSYLLQDFNNYANDINISKLSKQLFILLIKNPKLNKKNENNLIKSILLWLEDEMNIKEDISEIFYLIKWEEIDDDLIFELLIKYSHIILNDGTLEQFFLEIYSNKFGKGKVVESAILNLFKAIKKIEYYKLFGQVKKDEKIIENYRTHKMKTDNLKQNSRKILKKNELEIGTEKKYINVYTQTETILTTRGGASQSHILEEKRNNFNKKQDVSWKMSKIKNFVKEKNTSNSPSLNDYLKNKSKGILKKENNEIPKPISKSNKTTEKKFEKYNNKISDKNINKSKENFNINISSDFKIKQKLGINRYKSNINLSNSNNSKTEKKNKSNISLTKKPDSKVKEMLIFPYNLSRLKKFPNNSKNNKTSNSNLNSKKLDRYKSNKFIKSNASLSNTQDSFMKDKYYTGRINEKKKNKKIINRNRPKSDNKVKNSSGIIKEIRVRNNK